MSNEDKFIAARIGALRDRVQCAAHLAARADERESIAVRVDAHRFLAEAQDALAEAEYEALLNVESFLGYREKAS